MGKINLGSLDPDALGLDVRGLPVAQSGLMNSCGFGGRRLQLFVVAWLPVPAVVAAAVLTLSVTVSAAAALAPVIPVAVAAAAAAPVVSIPASA